MSWSIVKSGNLFSFVTSGSRGWAKFYSDKGPVFLRMGNLDHDSISLDLRDIQRVRPPGDTEGTRTRVQPLDILISITADVGMIGIIPDNFEEAYINQHVSLARPRSTVHPQYLAWYLSSPAAQRQFRELQRGATKVGLGLDDIRAVDVPLPLIQEQRRIVAEIEKQFTRLDVGVAALRRVQANLKSYRAAVLKAACEGSLVPTEAELGRTGIEHKTFESGETLLAKILTERRKNWKGRGKYKEPATPDVSSLPRLPKGWTWATADQLTSVITDGEHITPKRTSSGILLLSARNVLDGQILLDDVDYVPQYEYDRIAKRLVIVPGDVLLSCSGSVGRSAVVPEGLQFTLVRSVAVLKPLFGMGKYLSIALRSPFLKQQITEKQTQTAQANIFQGKIKVLCLPLPPLAEQRRLVAEVERRLSVIMELATMVSDNLQRAARLRQAILQEAFTEEHVQS